MGEDDDRVETQGFPLLFQGHERQRQTHPQVTDEDEPHGQGQSGGFTGEQTNDLEDHVDPGHHDLEPEQDGRGHDHLLSLRRISTTNNNNKIAPFCQSNNVSEWHPCYNLNN